jgi:hypothetical protein
MFAISSCQIAVRELVNVAVNIPTEAYGSRKNPCVDDIDF